MYEKYVIPKASFTEASKPLVAIVLRSWAVLGGHDAKSEMHTLFISPELCFELCPVIGHMQEKTASTKVLSIFFILSGDYPRFFYRTVPIKVHSSLTKYLTSNLLLPIQSIPRLLISYPR